MEYPPRAFLARLAFFVAISSAALKLYVETFIGGTTQDRDGDTIEVQGDPIRLEGVAAPQSA